MDKKKFLESLEMQLSDLTSEERREALEYYEEYFADAGEENEADVLISLGSPEQAAEQIKAGLHKADEGMFTENGYREKTESDNPPEVYGKANRQENEKRYAQGGTRADNYVGGEREQSRDAGQSSNGYAAQGEYDSQYAGQNQNGYADQGRSAGQSQNQYTDQNRAQYQNGAGSYQQSTGRQNAYGQNQYGWQGQQTGKKKNMSGGMTALLIVLGILALPVIFGLGAGLLGVVAGIFGVVFGVIVTMLALVLGLLVIGIGMFILGIPLLLHNPFSGLLCIAAGCIFIALFLLCVLLLVIVLGKFFPWLIREIESFGKYLSRKWSERKQKGRGSI